MIVREERPIVFTITRTDRTHYTLRTTDTRAGTNRPSPEVTSTKLFLLMKELSRMFNDVGYAVLFEVD